MKIFTDPWRRSLALATALGFGGAVALLTTWLGVSRTTDISDQVSFVMSGGFGGIALVGVGISLCLVQTRRRATALERRDFAVAARDFRLVAEAIVARRTLPSAEEGVAERQRRRRASRRATRPGRGPASR